MRMILLRAALMLLCVINCATPERVRLEAKKLIRGKVTARGYSLPAKSLSHCIDYCNLNNKICDGVVYHEVIKKCRLIYKCEPARQVDNSSSAVYYSRRPQIMTPDYFYDSKSDSCFGLINSKVDYASADNLCKKHNAHLAMISGGKVNDILTVLLTRSGLKWAWINDGNVAHEASLIPHGISGNDVLSQEVFSPEVVQWRNASYRSCWGVNYQGQWGQFSCKNDTMAAFCQVPRFKM